MALIIAGLHLYCLYEYMAPLILSSIPKKQQYFISTLLVVSIAAICYLLSAYVGYKTVALLLLVTVSLTAIFFDIKPVLLAAVLSALIWNFFFIPPRFTFHIESAEDILMFLMYFFIALVNAVLTFKIRQTEKTAQKKEEKENTLKLYNTLLDSLSHELRTPIATIIGATDNLQANNHNLSDNNKGELVNEIFKASLRLNRQVENLLNMSRLESGTLQLKKDWCDINELVHDVVNHLREQAKNHVINIQVKDNLPLFKLDFGVMEQVLYNIIYNAILYTPDYCLITVRAAIRDEKLILTVEDNGTGFPEEELNNVFDKFYRLRNSRTGGTGLGLSIVKGFVEAHDGTVILENMSEGGARFTITIATETSYINNLKNE